VVASTRRTSPQLVLIVAGVTLLVSMAVCAAAILTPAPPAAVPLVVIVCVGCPLFAAWQVPVALAALRARRSGRHALSMLRRSLDELPETEHPLGL
jgi:O-antigen/teichoic acid export membrane protein